MHFGEREEEARGRTQQAAHDRRAPTLSSLLVFFQGVAHRIAQPATCSLHARHHVLLQLLLVWIIGCVELQHRQSSYHVRKVAHVLCALV